MAKPYSQGECFLLVGSLGDVGLAKGVGVGRVSMKPPHGLRYSIHGGFIETRPTEKLQHYTGIGGFRKIKLAASEALSVRCRSLLNSLRRDMFINKAKVAVSSVYFFTPSSTIGL